MITRAASTLSALSSLSALSTLSALLLLASPAAATADEVRLMNGDRITGRVESLAAGTLVVSSRLGQLRIPWTEIVALTIDEPLTATLATGETRTVAVRAGTADRSVELDPGGPALLTDIVALARPQPFTLNGSANAGFVSSAGNSDVNSTHADGDVVARAGANRYTLSALVNRSEDNDVERARNWSTSIKYDRFLSPRLFVNANAIWTSDRFRDLDLRTALGAGLGYEILQTPIVRLTADAGLGWVDENLESGLGDRYTAVREATTLTIAAIPDLIELFHQHDGYFGVTGDDDLFIRMQNGVRVRLAGGFVTTLRLDLDYDRSPAPDRRNTDKTVALTLGYRF